MLATDQRHDKPNISPACMTNQTFHLHSPLHARLSKGKGQNVKTLKQHQVHVDEWVLWEHVCVCMRVCKSPHVRCIHVPYAHVQVCMTAAPSK
jgi:hypothetical protein